LHKNAPLRLTFEERNKIAIESLAAKVVKMPDKGPQGDEQAWNENYKKL